MWIIVMLRTYVTRVVIQGYCWSCKLQGSLFKVMVIMMWKATMASHSYTFRVPNASGISIYTHADWDPLSMIPSRVSSLLQAISTMFLCTALITIMLQERTSIHNTVRAIYTIGNHCPVPHVQLHSICLEFDTKLHVGAQHHDYSECTSGWEGESRSFEKRSIVLYMHYSFPILPEHRNRTLAGHSRAIAG